MNDPNYLSEANLVALAEDAAKWDYGLGPNESAGNTNSMFVSPGDLPMPLPEKEQN